MKKQSAHVQRRLREVAAQARRAELDRIERKRLGKPSKPKPTRPVALLMSDADVLRDIANGLRRAHLINYAAELDRIAVSATEPHRQGTAEEIEANAGARIADNCACQICGARGWPSLCPGCQDEANREGR